MAALAGGGSPHSGWFGLAASLRLNVLESSLLIGRPCGQGMRELVISRGARGYVALYRYVAGIDTVLVLVIRAQRKAGFVR